MKLVIVHTDVEAFQPLQPIIPSALIPAMIKPIIQHQLELAYQDGVRECVLLASDGIEKIRSFCGNGNRFGISVQLYSGVRSGSEVQSLTKHRSLFKTPFLVISGSIQATLPLSKIMAEHNDSGAKLTIVRNEESREPLAYVCSSGAWEMLKGHDGSLEDAGNALIETNGDDTRLVNLNVPYLKCSDLRGVLTLNSKVLRDQSITAFSTLREMESGVFIGHHVVVDPKAVIHPPVAIGDFCQIMGGAAVGPDVSIGHETVVGKKAVVRNAVIYHNSYIGELTQVKDAIVAGSSLVNLRSGVKIVVNDSFLLDKVSTASISQTADSLMNRAVALGMLSALAPVWLAVRALAKKKQNEAVKSSETVGNGDLSSRDDIDYLPRFQKLSAASDMPLSWYPTLINILKGQMRFVGPGPVSPEEAREIDGIGHEKRFEVPPGLVPIGDIFGGDLDETRIAEIIYSKDKSLSKDVRILIARFLLSIIGKSKAVRLAGL